MIHSLCELPASGDPYSRDFYVYLLDYGWEEGLSTEMYRHFLRMAEAASRHGAVVVRGTVGHHFADEVLSWHQVNGANATDLLPAILVTTKHPQAFREGNWGNAAQRDRLLLIPLRGVCASPRDVAPLIERLFSDIQQKRRLSQFEIANRMVAGRDGATLDAVVLKPSLADGGVEFSEAVSFLNNDLRIGSNEEQAMNGIRVFISHSAKDAALAKAFVDCVEACVEVPDKALRCTSVSGYRLAPGDVSDEVLRDNLEQCSVVVGLLTEESLRSGYVVMELGAAWGLKKTTCALLAPRVDFDSVPGPLSRRHAVMTDSDHDIVSVMEVIAEKTGWPLRNRARSTAAVRTFVTVVNTTSSRKAPAVGAAALAGAASKPPSVQCPIDACTKEFRNTVAGWDRHVEVPGVHPKWHPEEMDHAKRKRLFKEEFPGWFKRFG
jgi:hypothetical protein